MITYRTKNFVCALDLDFDLLRGKWKAVIENWSKKYFPTTDHDE